jgi:hypothetical protein
MKKLPNHLNSKLEIRKQDNSLRQLRSDDGLIDFTSMIILVSLNHQRYFKKHISFTRY